MQKTIVSFIVDRNCPVIVLLAVLSEEQRVDLCDVLGCSRESLLLGTILESQLEGGTALAPHFLGQPVKSADSIRIRKLFVTELCCSQSVVRNQQKIQNGRKQRWIFRRRMRFILVIFFKNRGIIQSLIKGSCSCMALPEYLKQSTVTSGKKESLLKKAAIIINPY